MKTTQLLVLTLLLTAWYSCGSGSETAQEAAFTDEQEKLQEDAYAEAYAAHDEFMPRTNQIIEAERELKILRDGQNLPDTAVAEIDRVMGEMEQANDAMMTWMQQWKPLDTLRLSGDHEAVMRQLTTDGTEIQAIGRAMELSIERAQLILGRYQVSAE